MKDLIVDLEETFSTLHGHNLKLNPRKCIFGVRSGKFWGYIVTKRGIDANPEKVQALCNMQSPMTLCETQRLVKHLIVLSRLISRLVDRSLPFL